MELVIRDDGLLTDKAVQELAAWYSGGDDDQETFEAHLMMLRAYNTLVTSAQRGRRTNLSLERYALLRLLYLSPQRRMLMNEISRALNVSPTSVTKLVNALENAGLVTKSGFSDDKRKTWAEITSRGAGVVQENLPSVRRFTRERWQGLSNHEKRVLIHLLAKLVLSTQSIGAEERIRAVESEAASVLQVPRRRSKGAG
jgi:MarR family transcriptional regulator, 2-MHQ and catechol-resistance regulon repressor